MRQHSQMANFVRSLGEKIAGYFKRPAVGRRAAKAFPSLFQRWWGTLPAYLPFYIILPVVFYAAWYGRQPSTVIMPFHLPPENKEKPLPFSGDAVADTLQDAITSIRAEAAGYPPLPPCDFPRQKGLPFGGLKAEARGSFEVRGPVTVEVKGISPEALVSAAREVFGKETYISGNVLIVPEGFQLLAQANDNGPWMTKPEEISLQGLRIAGCELAEDILGATNKNVLAAAWLRRRDYARVIDLYGDLPADWDDPDALNNLGVALRESNGRTDDAVSRFQQALSLRTCYHHMADPFARYSQFLQRECFPEGHYNLAIALGNKGQVQESIAEDRKAIEIRPNYAQAHDNLAHSFEDIRQYDRAIVEFHKAMRDGDYAAMTGLGFMYGKGLGVAQDYQQAMTWFRKAADAGDSTGMANLGVMYENGIGVAQDYAQAVSWYRKAADAGEEGAMTNLGFMYEKGNGVGQDYGQAVSWYRKAADAGEPMGMNNLGGMYEKGKGVAQDHGQAVSWYRKAASLGNEKAKENLKRLGEKPQ